MFVYASAIALIANLSGGVTPCPDDVESDAYFLDVCDPSLGGEPAFSVLMSASLNPAPASQSVVISRYEDQWLMSVAGYKWQPGTALVETRRNEIVISDADAEALAAVVEAAPLNELAARPYYGSDDVICTDGARYELAMAEQGEKLRVAQHSCAGKTELNGIMGAFRQLALKYDPAFEGMLSGLAE